jgi:hypothetical protein
MIALLDIAMDFWPKNPFNLALAVIKTPHFGVGTIGMYNYKVPRQ